MNKLQTKRLKESKAHWERMRDDPECGEEPSSIDCPCCREFNNKRPFDECRSCPIAQFTGKPVCIETPFSNACEEYDYNGINSDSFREAAQAEIDFLNEVLKQ